jgi:hypothetical protein
VATSTPPTTDTKASSGLRLLVVLPTAINSPYEHNEESSSVESSTDLRSVWLSSSHRRSRFGS